MNEFHQKLADRFCKQQQFTKGYSPLYSRLFGALADWFALENPAADPVVSWLLAVGRGRASFDVPLLLMAAVHRDILDHHPAASQLAEFFPSVGGSRNSDDPFLPDCLKRFLVARKDQIGEFIKSSTVQTNETTRGFCWIFPLLYTGFTGVHLIDLGASAGLNLVADKRKYQLTGLNHFFEVGLKEADSFSITSKNPCLLPAVPRLPRIVSRNGCDSAPIHLQTTRDENILTSFIWGDQLARLDSLRQGIAALQAIAKTDAPVSLSKITLPDELPLFLQQQIDPLPVAPVVLYNTYITTYLRDKGMGLKRHIDDWARRRDQPVLWLQWETLWEGPEPPEFGWVGWTADLWLQNEHFYWQLAWAHPHGSEVIWLDDLAEWASFWSKRPGGSAPLLPSG